MYVQLLMLGGILLGVLIFKGKNEESFGELDSSEHPLKIMYPFALVLYRLVKKKGKEDVFGRREVLREVFINESPELSQRIQGCKCIASILAVIAITCFISFAYEYANEPALVDAIVGFCAEADFDVAPRYISVFPGLSGKEKTSSGYSVTVSDVVCYK